MVDDDPGAREQPLDRAGDRLGEGLGRLPREQLREEAGESRVRNELELRDCVDEFCLAQ